ncbi:hypothetical protein, partial [Streptomyces sp. SID5770]|uniref:hypothetical protein n=1 Tax=Streptomyces sp. SID5770 TaxID=2690308 RepID=UPI0031BA9616
MARRRDLPAVPPGPEFGRSCLVGLLRRLQARDVGDPGRPGAHPEHAERPRRAADGPRTGRACRSGLRARPCS